MGSTAFAGSVDTILVMRRTERTRSLSSVQRYGTDLDEVVLSMDDTGRIVADIRDKRFNPVTDALATARVTKPSGETVDVPLRFTTRVGRVA